MNLKLDPKTSSFSSQEMELDDENKDLAEEETHKGRNVRVRWTALLRSLKNPPVGDNAPGTSTQVDKRRK